MELQEKIKEIQKYNQEHIYFDQEDHKYYVDGLQVESVSSFIQPLNERFMSMIQNNIDFAKVVSAKAKIGINVHKLTENWDANKEIQVDTNSEEYKLFTNYVTFTTQHPNLRILANELIVYSEKHDLIGTIDRLLYDEDTNKVILMDIKTGSEQDIHWYQQIVYKDLLRAWNINVDEVALLSLKGQEYKFKIWSSKQTRAKDRMNNTYNEFLLSL